MTRVNDMSCRSERSLRLQNAPQFISGRKRVQFAEHSQLLSQLFFQ